MPGAYQRFSVDQIPSQQGKIALVTGGNGGIGYQTVKQLALAGAKVYMASRSEEKATKAIKELKEEAEKQGKQVQIEFISIDLCSLQSAVDCAKEFSSREKSLDLLVCNAGIMAVPHELTKDGLEIQFQSNYLTHHLLFLELVPQLKAAASQSGTPSRVVNLSSVSSLCSLMVIVYTTTQLSPSLLLPMTVSSSPTTSSPTPASALPTSPQSKPSTVNSVPPKPVTTSVIPKPNYPPSSKRDKSTNDIQPMKFELQLFIQDLSLQIFTKEHQSLLLQRRF